MFVVHTIPAFSDNYIWLFHQQDSNLAYVVDPGDATPVLEKLDELNLSLAGILVTHQHADHIGGIPDLLHHVANNIPVYGPSDISVVNHAVSGGDKVEVAGTSFEVLSVPGHTLNHLAYFSSLGKSIDVNGLQTNHPSPVLFCGDTLFAAGCGRLFEGTPAQMYHSLKKIRLLPENTQVYCAHEYTLANLKFAHAVDANNSDLQQRIEQCQQLRKKNIPTVPFTLADDLKSNPFLRSSATAIINAAKQRTVASDPVSVFGAIRDWKDNF